MTQEEIMKSVWIGRNANDGVYIKVQELYKYLHDHIHLKVTPSGNIFLYDSSGVWKQITANICMGIIKSFLPVRYRTYKHWRMIFEEFVTDLSDVEEKDFNADETIINFQNGILDLRTMELKPHSPEYFTTIQIPCEYKPNLTWDSCPTFQKYLTDLLGNDTDTKTFLLQVIGLVCSNIFCWRLKKILLLVGDGNTGKSILRELTMRLIGLENCVSIELKRLGERFGSSALYGKRLAGSGDLSVVELSDVELLKQASGGDELYAEFKGKDSFSFRYDGLIWCNCNKLPYFRGDRGQWVYDRFCIVRCNNIIPPEKQDKHLLDKLLAEKEAIISIAIRKLTKVIQDGYRFTESESMRKERYAYSIENNSLLTFVNDCCELNHGKTLRSKFNQVYIAWCRLNRVQPERLRDIEPQLTKMFGISSTKNGGYFEYPLVIKSDVIREQEETLAIPSKR